MLAFFDAPRAFECEPMTVDTFAVWETGPGLDPFGPRQARARGLGAVPIWFVRTDDLDRAESDGVLTIPELEALDPLMGHASLFTETLHPAGAVENVVLVVNARGTLEDGRSFSLHITLHVDRRIVRGHLRALTDAAPSFGPSPHWPRRPSRCAGRSGVSGWKTDASLLPSVALSASRTHPGNERCGGGPL